MTMTMTMTTETDWQPIQKKELADLLSSSIGRMSHTQRCLWDVIAIQPVKWSEPTFGKAGGGFWAVAVFGINVIYFNDIEDGFNVSPYVTHGVIADYHCNQDDLETVIATLLVEIETGKSNFCKVGRPQSVL